MRLLSLTAAAFLGLTALVAAQPYAEPDQLLEAFYAPYLKGEVPDYDESQFRSAALNALYAQDAANMPEGEIGALDFDPYIDGQDFEITDFEIGAAGIAGDYASADVTFKNFGEPRMLAYELVLEDGGWKIDDVVSANEDNAYRLTELLAPVGAD